MPRRAVRRQSPSSSSPNCPSQNSATTNGEDDDRVPSRPVRERRDGRAEDPRPRRAGRDPRTRTLSHATVPAIGSAPRPRRDIGESATIGSTPAVHNPVIDALAPLGVHDVPMPATPQRVWQAVEAARG
jgi:hypothetical protein